MVPTMVLFVYELTLHFYFKNLRCWFHLDAQSWRKYREQCSNLRYFCARNRPSRITRISRKLCQIVGSIVDMENKIEKMNHVISAAVYPAAIIPEGYCSRRSYLIKVGNERDSAQLICCSFYNLQQSNNDLLFYRFVICTTLSTSKRHSS